MNILYINGHPASDGSFHEAIQAIFVDNIADTHVVKSLELGKERFDPVLRFGYKKRMPHDEFIARSQELVKWADHIVFAFPVWWGDAPALMKGWVERVFTPGVTYHVKGFAIDGLLRGASADIIITQRGVRPVAWLFGNHHRGIFIHNLFKLCGIKCRRVIALGGVGLVPLTDNEKRRSRFLERIAKAARLL